MSAFGKGHFFGSPLKLSCDTDVKKSVPLNMNDIHGTEVLWSEFAGVVSCAESARNVPFLGRLMQIPSSISLFRVRSAVFKPTPAFWAMILMLGSMVPGCKFSCWIYVFQLVAELNIKLLRCCFYWFLMLVNYFVVIIHIIHIIHIVLI